MASPASRVAAVLALLAVSQAERMTRSASRLRSKISPNVSSPSDPGAAEAGQQRRLRRAPGLRRGDDAVGREMDHAIMVEVGPGLDRSVAERRSGDDLGAASGRRPASVSRAICSSLAEIGCAQAPSGSAQSRSRRAGHATPRGRRRFLPRPRYSRGAVAARRLAHVAEGARRNRGGDVAVAAEPLQPAEIEPGVAAGRGALAIGVDPGVAP